MVCRMVSKVARQDIVPFLGNVIGGIKISLRIQSRVMVVGMPGSDIEGDHHGQSENEKRVDPVIVKKESQHAECDEGHPQEGFSVLGESSSHSKAPRISGQCCCDRILKLSHGLTLFSFPARLIPFLVAVIQMVSQNVVQCPGVGHHSRLKTVDQLQQAVQ